MTMIEIALRRKYNSISYTYTHPYTEKSSPLACASFASELDDYERGREKTDLVEFDACN